MSNRPSLPLHTEDFLPRIQVLPPSVRHRHNRRTAFSLVEVMIVLVIIGLLAGLVTVNVRGYVAKGRQDAARTQIAAFKQGLDTWYTINHRYPTNDEGLEVLTLKTDKLPEPLLERIPRDPWGKPYQYIQPGRNGPYEIISFGADGREGGQGGDRDIGSDEPASEPSKP